MDHPPAKRPVHLLGHVASRQHTRRTVDAGSGCRARSLGSDHGPYCGDGARSRCARRTVRARCRPRPKAGSCRASPARRTCQDRLLRAPRTAVGARASPASSGAFLNPSDSTGVVPTVDADERSRVAQDVEITGDQPLVRPTRCVARTTRPGRRHRDADGRRARFRQPGPAHRVAGRPDDRPDRRRPARHPRSPCPRNGSSWNTAARMSRRRCTSGTSARRSSGRDREAAGVRRPRGDPAQPPRWLGQRRSGR